MTIGCLPEPIPDRRLILVTDTATHEVGVPPDLGVTYSPVTIEFATGSRLGRDWMGLETILWRGDGRMYVDVFDRPFATFGALTRGIEYGHFIRYDWRDSPQSFPWIVGDLIGDEPAALDPDYPDALFGPWQTVRVYDRGACSAGQNWRSILTPIAAGLDERILGELRGGGFNADSLGNSSIDPILRDPFTVVANTLDAFRIRRVYSFHTRPFANETEGWLCGGVLRIRFRGRFAGQGLELRYILEDVENVSVEAGFPCDQFADAKIAAPIRGALEAELEPAITEQARLALASPYPGAIRCREDSDCIADASGFVSSSGVPPLPARNVACIDQARGNATVRLCAIVPNVHRVHERPEGIEVVLVDDPGDPWANLLPRADPAICDRGPSDRGPYGGFFGTVFDPGRPAGSRRVFGDD